jgi:hypothetical protein
VLATGMALHDYLYNKWRDRSHIYARDEDGAAHAMLETCKACLVAYDAEFTAHVKLLVTRAPPDVRRHCLAVYMLLRFGPFRGNKDVCWLIMTHVFASGSSDAFETAVSIVTKYPTAVKMVEGIWSENGVNRWVHENIKPRVIYFFHIDRVSCRFPHRLKLTLLLKWPWPNTRQDTTMTCGL